jgi:2-hydroxy-3-keto-5-methylthiopentenyl-1-phosphate phosphatase
VAGKIGSRECLSRQIELVKAKPEEVASLVSKVSIDPNFVPFLHRAEELGVLVTIVSDGFDFFIEQILKRNLKEEDYLKALPIFSNRLEAKDGGFRPSFATEPPCEHGCANCKPAVIKRLTAPDDHVFFVGDGLSDRFAAQVSNVTFAKAKLLEYCRQQRLDHIAFDDFKKITDWLTENHMLLKKASFRQ